MTSDRTAAKVAASKKRYDDARVNVAKVWPWAGFDKQAVDAALRKMEIVPTRGHAIVGVCDFAQLDAWIAENPDAITSEFLFTLGSRAFRAGISSSKSKIASAKNKDAITWVLSEWEARSDKGQSKASFSIQYARLLKTKFPEMRTITARTIERDWLPKGNK